MNIMVGFVIRYIYIYISNPLENLFGMGFMAVSLSSVPPVIPYLRSAGLQPGIPTPPGWGAWKFPKRIRSVPFLTVKTQAFSLRKKSTVLNEGFRELGIMKVRELGIFFDE